MKARNKNAPGATGANKTHSENQPLGPVMKKFGKGVEVAHCTRCGSGFKRGTTQRWKTLCLPCWRWTRMADLHAEVMRLQRGLQ